MKRITILTAAAALIMGTASAQDFGSQQQRPERKQFTPEQIAERRVENLSKTLELTDEQKKEVYNIYLSNAAEQQKEMEAMRKIMQEQREKQKAREKALDEQMQKLLDASQYKKWLKQQQAQQSRGRFPAQGGFQRPTGEGFGGPGQGGPGQGGGFDNGMGF